MCSKQFVLTDPAEAAVVDQIQVRLVRPEEEAEWNQLMVENHYLKSAQMVGEQLRYVAECQGRWMGLLGWSAAAYHLKGREGWIGWDDNQRCARLHLVANNARFCRLEAARPYPNLATRAMGLNLEGLSRDWQQKYGHPIVVVESFVDLEWFQGTAYRATGWEAVGCTAQFKRVREDFYQAHDRPKQLFVRELVKHAARGLRERELPEAWGAQERQVERCCAMDKEGLRSLWEVLHEEVPESRDVHGLRHRQATVLVFQQALWSWQKGRHGSADGGAVVLDGKALRGSGKTQLVGAINAASGRTLGVETVADKSNEIPAGQTLLDRLDLEGAQCQPGGALPQRHCLV